MLSVTCLLPLLVEQSLTTPTLVPVLRFVCALKFDRFSLCSPGYSLLGRYKSTSAAGMDNYIKPCWLGPAVGRADVTRDG